MNAIQRKLRSRKGASITYALLIFLVCAMASSAIVVAASTAGGRLSTVREMDQRYYAVTAAAEVLRDRLDGKYAVVDYPKDGEDTDDDKNVLIKVSKAVLTGTGTPMSWSPDSPAGAEDYTCKIDGSLKDGLMVFDISATGGKINKDGKYTLRMVFASAIQKEEDPATPGTGKAKVTWNLNSIKKIKA